MSIPLALYQAVVLENPRWLDETVMHYIERVAILAGALPREDAGYVKPGTDVKERRPVFVAERGSWLPYVD